jgi:hypothetical protein
MGIAGEPRDALIPYLPAVFFFAEIDRRLRQIKPVAASKNEIPNSRSN